MINVDTIFDLLGGPAEAGRAIGKSTEHAATMRRGSIPVRYWAALMSAAQSKGVEGIDQSTLLAAHAAGACRTGASVGAAA